jgi:hypothetical protein
MAATPLSRSCPIRIVSVHLLDAAGQLLRVLFLDSEGHISVKPHYVPPRRGPDPGLQSAEGARSSCRGAVALSTPWPEAVCLWLSGADPGGLICPGKSQRTRRRLPS